MRRLSSLDAQFLAAEHGNFGSLYCGLGVYETKRGESINAATMKRLLAERLGQCPQLRWKVVTVPFGLDHPVFIDVDVNLKDHISETTLGAPADEATLAAEVANILSTPLDRDKPLWRIRVIHGLPRRTAVVITLHHAVADGISAGEILTALLDVNGRAASITMPRSPIQPDAVPSQVGLAARGLASLPLRRARSLGSTPRTLAHLDQVPALRSLPGVHTLSRVFRGETGGKRLDAPRTRFNAKLSAARSVAFGTVSLTDVKAVKNALGITVNDVVIALCAGALRRRMTTTGDLPTEPLVAYLPVSTRLPDAKDRSGNAISSIIAPIPTHLEDPRDRLAFTHETLDRAKRRSREAPATLMSDVNDPIPVPVFGIAARGLMDLMSSRFVRPAVNLIISNVPGSPVTLTCLGAPLLAHYPLSVIFDGFTLNITVVSYRDGLDIGIVGDAATLPDAWDLLSDIRIELGDLVERVATERSFD